MLEKLFGLTQRGTTVKTEIIAGLPPLLPWPTSFS